MSEQDVNKKDKNCQGRTELHRAAERNKLQLVKELLSRKANVNARDNSKRTPLHLVAKNNRGASHFRVAEVLLKNGADPNAGDKSNHTPLYYLLIKGNIRIVRLFLDFKARVNVKTRNKENLLFPAVRNYKNPAVLQLLIDSGLDVDQCNHNGQTPLATLLRPEFDHKVHLGTIKTLLKHNANANVRGSRGQTLLYFAVSSDDLEFFRLLLNYKAEVGAYLLHSAINCNRYNFVKLLIEEFNLEVNHPDIRKLTPMHKAASSNNGESHYEIIELLYEKGADLSARDAWGQTPFWYLVQRGSSKVVQLFLDFKADINVVNKYEENLLFSALPWIEDENLDCFRFLVDLGLNVNHRSRSGATLMHEVAKHNFDGFCFKIAELLLKNKAEVNARDDNNLPALYNLVTNCDCQMLKLFLDFEADFRVTDDHGENLLFPALRNTENPEVLQALIDLGLNINHRNKSGKTPLHSACEYEEHWCYDNKEDRKEESYKMVKCLLKNGASLSVVDENGNTPLISAIRRYSDWDSRKRKVDFILKYIDFDDTGNLYDALHSGCSLSSYPNSFKIFLKQLAKLQSLQNAPVGLAVLRIISDKDEYSGYYKQCQEELSRAKSTKIKDCWITFYNLLMDGRKKLKNYAGNEDLIGNYRQSGCRDSFPIYGDSIDKNVTKGIERRELFDESSVILSNCLPVFNSTHLIIRDVLDCILSTKDLSKFCK